MLIFSSSPLPSMRLPAKKEYKNNVWVESLPSSASQKEIEVQVVEQTSR